MKTYFTHLSSANRPTNQLQREILAVLEAESNLLTSDAGSYITRLIDEICRLNSENPRCKSIVVSTDITESWVGPNDPVHVWFVKSEGHLATFVLYPVKDAEQAANQNSKSQTAGGAK